MVDGKGGDVERLYGSSVAAHIDGEPGEGEKEF